MSITLGAFLNAIGILLGALIGLARSTPLSLKTQLQFRNGIALMTLISGLGLVFQSVSGSTRAGGKQVFIAFLAIILGFWLGKLLRLQKLSNYLGRLASGAIAAAQKNQSKNSADGFNACAILFCAAPLGILGAVADGLSNYFYLLAVKAIMDGLAMSGFVKIFRWPAALSAIPVFSFLNAVALAMQLFVKPALSPHLTDSITATAGFLACIITIVIFEIRKVELANYLPALVIAPLLTKLFGW